MEELLKILKEIRPDVDFENEKTLIDDEILDSLDVISIVGEINDFYDIQINVGDMKSKNFNNIDAIMALIESKK